jgi:hypothetical protein
MNDLTGIQYGRLTVIKHTRTDKEYRTFWLCRCICGQEVEARSDGLVSGGTKSCGCLSKENMKLGRIGTHKRSGTSEHNIWQTMKARCSNPNNSSYKNYGGRGITVCDSWKEFANFYKDMGSKPAGKSLDRINNDGPYSPENCRWATQKEQCNNYRRNIVITFRNETHTLTEWSAILGIRYATLRKRLSVLHHSVEKAFLKRPNRKVAPSSTFHDLTHSTPG